MARALSGHGGRRFWFVVQGAPEDNTALAALVPQYSMVRIFDSETGEYSSENRLRGCRRLVQHLRGRWLMLVDSDEFVEFPPQCASMEAMARALTDANADCLYAPMLQRVAEGGALIGLDPGQELHTAYPLGVPGLYAQMGVPRAKTYKHPFFLNRDDVEYVKTHDPPQGSTVTGQFLGVTHHYKWRRAARARISERANSAHTWAGESQQIVDFLAAHDWRLPMEGAFCHHGRARPPRVLEVKVRLSPEPRVHRTAARINRARRPGRRFL